MDEKKKDYSDDDFEIIELPDENSEFINDDEYYDDFEFDDENLEPSENIIYEEPSEINSGNNFSQTQNNSPNIKQYDNNPLNQGINNTEKNKNQSSKDSSTQNANTKSEKNKQNAKNNTETLNNAAKAAEMSGEPHAMAIGKTYNLANKLSGGKIGKKAGQKLNRINKRTPAGHQLQNSINNANSMLKNNKPSSNADNNSVGSGEEGSNSPVSKVTDLAKNAIKAKLNKIKWYIIGGVGSVIFSLISTFFVPILLIIIIAYFISIISSFINGIFDFGESLWNAVQLNGWRTNEQVYYCNIDGTDYDYCSSSDGKIGGYLRSDSIEIIYEPGSTQESLKEKIKYYINSTTFYSTVTNPELLKIDGDGNNNESTSEDTQNSPEDANMFVNSAITTNSELRQKYARIKDDPKDLIPNMFACTDSDDDIKKGYIEKSSSNKTQCKFSEEKYADYLLYGDKSYSDLTSCKGSMDYDKCYSKGYVARRFLDCSDDEDSNVNNLSQCPSYRDKPKVAKSMTEEIMEQAKSFHEELGGKNRNAAIAVPSTISGITVKNSSGNVIGTYSVSEYISTRVAITAGEYDNEVKKAYAVYLLSQIYSKSLTEVVFNNFDVSLATNETKKLVDEVINLRLVKNGRIYDPKNFDFEEATKIIESESENDYRTILKNFYPDTDIEEIVSNGLQKDPTTGFLMRLEPPNKNDSQYYGSDSSGLIGECAWYATNRAQEITKTLSDVSEWGSENHNGNAFCYGANANSKYKTCWPSKGENCEPKQGSMISWGYKTGPYASYGHVGIIEQVSGNEVLLSDSGLTRGAYGMNRGYDELTKYLKKMKITRTQNCTINPDRSCIRISKVTKNSLKTGPNGRYIICYIYLTEPKT